MSNVGWRPRLVTAALVAAVAMVPFSLGDADDASAAPATVADTNVLFGNGNGAVQGGCGGLDTLRGNRTTDPMFLNFGLRNLHLGTGSSAFDYAGAAWSPWWDFDGEARPQGAAADVGAFEDSGG